MEHSVFYKGSGWCKNHKIEERMKELEEKGFDFGYDEYIGSYTGNSISSKHLHAAETGKIMNLIEAMEIGGASDEEFARVIKYLFVVSDMAKQFTDWKKAHADLRVSELREKYTSRR